MKAYDDSAVKHRTATDNVARYMGVRMLVEFGILVALIIGLI